MHSIFCNNFLYSWIRIFLCHQIWWHVNKKKFYNYITWLDFLVPSSKITLSQLLAFLLLCVTISCSLFPLFPFLYANDDKTSIFHTFVNSHKTNIWISNQSKFLTILLYFPIHSPFWVFDFWLVSSVYIVRQVLAIRKW